MAGLYYDQDPAFVLDSFLVTNSLDNMSSFNEYGTYFYPMLSNHEYLEEIPLDIQIHETSPLYRSCSVETPFSCASNDPSLSTVVKHESDSSVMVAEQLFNASADKFTQARTPMQEKTKNTDRKAKERRIKRIPKKQKKVPEEASSGYVLVRARRGEATDSHSLAERVRREKISVRMKQLQSLVPGCDQMTGKVLILDHIIKYVQTLQTQVQFLAAKLVSVNPVCLSDCKVNLDTNTVAQEMTSSLDFQPPTVADFSSTQIESISSESSTLITPNFMLLDQEQRSNITFQDNDNLQLWGADDCWINELANYSELYNISSF